MLGIDFLNVNNLSEKNMLTEKANDLKQKKNIYNFIQ